MWIPLTLCLFALYLFVCPFVCLSLCSFSWFARFLCLSACLCFCLPAWVFGCSFVLCIRLCACVLACVLAGVCLFVGMVMLMLWFLVLTSCRGYCFCQETMSSTCPSDWLFKGFALRTRDAFLLAPFGYGGPVGHIKWKGKAVPSQRLAILDALRTALPGGNWTAAAAWPEQFKAGYKMLLSQYFSTSAVRALGAIAGLDLTGVAAGAQGVTAIIDLCLNAQVPIASPCFMAEYVRAVAKVLSGALPGGSPLLAVDFAAESKMLRETALAAQPAHTAPQAPGLLVSDPNAVLIAEVAALKSAMATMHAASASLTTPGGMTEAGLVRVLSMFQQANNKTAAETKEALPIAAKAKSGWPKVLDDVSSGLANGEYVNIARLSRGNKRHLEKESRSTSDSHKLSLGGATLLIAGPREDSTTVVMKDDGPLWTLLNAFFRFFSIMACLPETTFPRAKLADFMTLWLEIWDSPSGTRLEKAQAAVAFYKDHHESLGQGTWLSTFNANARFSINFLPPRVSPNTITPCLSCDGCGERIGQQDQRKSTSASDGNGKGKGRGQSGFDGKRNGSIRSPCLSMIDISVGKCQKGDCRFPHTPCPSCGGSCACAQECGAFDAVKITKEYGSLLNAIKRRRTN